MRTSEKHERNPVKRAVQIVGGENAPSTTAAAKAALLCGVSVATVYNWIALGCVEKLRPAILLAEATLAAGDPVSMRELAGLEAAGKPSDPPSSKTPRRSVRGMSAKGGTSTPAPSPGAASALNRLRLVGSEVG